MEARLQDSAWKYKQSNGILDLLPKSHNVDRTPDAFLLEINPRAPGMQEIAATARAYGVSYRSLGLLNAIADWTHMKALSVPFCGGAQYHMQIQFVSAQTGGVYQSGDVYTAVFDREPQLREHVVECMSFLVDGQEVPDPRTGCTTWIAFFLVVSRRSRQEALETGNRVQKLVREHIRDF
jgi:hypothetical protein